MPDPRPTREPDPPRNLMEQHDRAVFNAVFFWINWFPPAARPWVTGIVVVLIIAGYLWLTSPW